MTTRDQGRGGWTVQDNVLVNATIGGRVWYDNLYGWSYSYHLSDWDVGGSGDNMGSETLALVECEEAARSARKIEEAAERAAQEAQP